MKNLPDHIPFEYLKGKKIKLITVYGESYVKFSDIKDILNSSDNNDRDVMSRCERGNSQKLESSINCAQDRYCPECGGPLTPVF